MRMALWTTLLFLLSLGAVSMPAGVTQTPRIAVFHVDPDGDDAGPGSKEHPWRTLQHAADRASAGSKGLIDAGTYAGGIVLGVSGKAGSPILFSGPQDGTATSS